MHRLTRAGLCLAGWLIVPLAALPAAAQDADTVHMAHPPEKYLTIVSATRTARNPVDIPNGTAVVSGAELRRAGVHTVGEALQDIVGLDTGEGSDNGSRLPNVGMWGLKEFDAFMTKVLTKPKRERKSRPSTTERKR